MAADKPMPKVPAHYAPHQAAAFASSFQKAKDGGSSHGHAIGQAHSAARSAKAPSTPAGAGGVSLRTGGKPPNADADGDEGTFERGADEIRGHRDDITARRGKGGNV